MELKQRIEKILSEILSDKHECKITLTFEKTNSDKEQDKKQGATK
jgi:hypothetical protein